MHVFVYGQVGDPRGLWAGLCVGEGERCVKSAAVLFIE